MQFIKHGRLHLHSDNSKQDSPMSVKELVAILAQNGAPAAALTDHGVLTGVYEFVKRCKEAGIKPIPGIEAYVQEDNAVTSRRHLVLLAKDYEGYMAICQAVTASNSRIAKDTPRMNKKIIFENFGPGSAGYGKVIATSACVGGILSSILISNREKEEKISDLKKRQSKYASPSDAAYQGNLKLLAEHSEAVKTLTEQRNALKALADKKYTLRERAVSKLTGPEREAIKARLEAEKAESKAAAEELEQVKVKLATAKKKETMVRQAVKSAEKEHEKWVLIQTKIDTIEAQLYSDDELLEEAKTEAIWYKGVFGDDFYIELQYHGIPEEAEVMPKLALLAKELGIGVVAANDEHYARNDAKCVRARAIVQALRFNKSLPATPDDREYYLKTDAELTDWLLKILPEDTVSEAMENIGEITSRCNVQFPKETHFPKFVGGNTGETSEQRLRRLVEEGIQNRYPNQEFPYRERVEYELKVINDMHYTDYLCIVQDYLDYGRRLGKDNPEGVGYSIGPGRGSAAGSLVCYLIGITSVDPIPLNLLFERFLNPDRVSSPDIDADLSKAVRGEVLEYIKCKYGADAVCSILTKGTLAAKNAIRSVARVKGDELFGDTRYFLELSDKLTKLIPNVPDITLADCEEHLKALCSQNKYAKEIFEDAKLVEGAVVSFGMHAAGIIIADNGNVKDYIPLMWNEKNEQWTTQCDMVEAEKQAGLLKFDLLGLRNLDIISDTLRLIKRNTGLSIDIEKVPQEADIYREVFAKGKTDFIFQFESVGMKNLLKRFKPTKFEDIVLLNAMFRPGPLQYIDDVCDVRHSRKSPTYICEAIRPILESTYGFPIYQEQIMQLCNQVAGFSLGESDLIRRYMSKKQGEEMAKYKPKFVDGLVSNGATCEDAEDFWLQLEDFALYAFNKSHSAVYAMVAYYTAWLKYHYPTEYMTAIMNHTPVEKLPMMIDECRALGVEVMAPDINRSLTKFLGKSNKILFSLANIKGVASGGEEIVSERERGGPFRSYKDFLQRVRPHKDVCEALIDAGALDCWCSNRAAMKAVLQNMLNDIKKIAEKAEAASLETNAEKRASLEAKRDEYQARLDSTILPISLPENKRDRLTAEYELLGMYISGHPLDEYDLENVKAVLIPEIVNHGETVAVCGVVSGVRIKARKSDGKKMAFFTLQDKSASSIEVCCFASAYAEYGNLIDEENVLVIEGKVNIEESEEFGDKKQIYASKIRLIPPKQRKVVVSVKGMHRWAENVYSMLLPYSAEDGLPVIVHDTCLGELRQTTLKLSPDVLGVAEVEVDIKIV